MTRWLLAFGWYVQKSVVCPNPGSTTWWPFGRCGRSSFVATAAASRSRAFRRSGASRRSTSAPGCTGSSSGLRRPGVRPGAPPAQMKSVPGLPRIEPRSPPAEKYASAVGASWIPVAASSPHTNDSGKARSAISDMNQNPLASPFAAESHESIVIGAEIGAASRRRLHQPEEGREPHVALLDRQEPPAVRDVRGGAPHRRGEVVASACCRPRPSRTASA